MTGPSGVLRGAWRVVDRAREVEITFTAAGIAYYGIVALLPTLLLLVAALVQFSGDAVARGIVSPVGFALSGRGRQLLRDAILSAASRWQASALSAVVLLWGGFQLFRALNVAFARVYRLEPSISIPTAIRDAVLALGGVLLAVFVVAGFGTALAQFLGVTTSLGHPAVMTFVIALLLFPLYYVLPDEDVGVGEALPGVVTATVGWMLLRAGFETYVGFGDGDTVFGVFGALVLLVTVLWVASLAVLLGAVVNVVAAGRD